MKKLLRYGTGIGLVILGIIGFILPVMPGWPFFIPGLVILADEIPWLDRQLHRYFGKWWGIAKEKLTRARKPKEKQGTETEVRPV